MFRSKFHPTKNSKPISPACFNPKIGLFSMPDPRFSQPCISRKKPHIPPLLTPHPPVLLYFQFFIPNSHQSSRPEAHPIRLRSAPALSEVEPGWTLVNTASTKEYACCLWISLKRLSNCRTDESGENEALYTKFLHGSPRPILLNAMPTSA